MRPDRRDAQEFEQTAKEIREGSFGPFSLVALKTSWNVAKNLPRPPQSIAISGALSLSTLAHVLSALDCTKPLVVDVGCGVGSFARAMAHHAEASTPGDTSAPNAW